MLEVGQAKDSQPKRGRRPTVGSVSADVSVRTRRCPRSPRGPKRRLVYVGVEGIHSRVIALAKGLQRTGRKQNIPKRYAFARSVYAFNRCDVLPFP